MNIPLCTLLEWDSAFFGCRIARVEGDQLDAERNEQIMAWCAAERIDCLYFLCRSDDPASVRLAEDSSFRLVDLRVTLECVLHKGERPYPAAGIRPVQPSDIPTLRDIAAVSHTDTRFYADPNFNRTRAAHLYSAWIEKSARGDADAVLVALAADKPAGYISCHLDGDSAGHIGLIAVAEHARGQRLGSLLVDHALAWFAQQNVTRAQVVTQGRNITAQRLYQRRGFVTHSVKLWYHRWFQHP
jgi:dTDP-4-amino-4,6-dideoxy-D-galactose acyltransferase